MQFLYDQIKNCILTTTTREKIWILLTIYFSWKIIREIYKIIKINLALKNVPVNPGIPFMRESIFGEKFQNFGAFNNKREQLCFALAEGGRKLDTERSKVSMDDKTPRGVSKVYAYPFIPLLVITGKDIYEKLYNNPLLVNKDKLKPFMEDCTGPDCLLVQERKVWKSKRKLLMKTMHRELLDQYSSTLNENMFRFVNNITSKINNLTELPSPDKEDHKCIEIDLEHTMFQLNMEMGAAIIFGQKLDSESEQENQLLINAWLDNANLIELRWNDPILMQPIFWTIYNKLFYNNANVKCRNKFKDVIEKIMLTREKLLRQETEQNGKKSKKIVADVLLDLYHNKEITFDGMIDQASIFFVGALDTGSNTLTAILYELSRPKNRKVLEKLEAEIDQFFHEKEDLTKFDDAANVNPILNSMSYLDSVIKEALRLYGPAPILGRKIDGPGFELSEHVKIPGSFGLEVLSMPGFLEMDDKRFLPERFLESNSLNLKPIKVNDFAPFSVGPRDCIGKSLAYLQMKIQIIHFIKNFNLDIVVRDEHDLAETRPMCFKFVRKVEKSPVVRVWPKK